MLIADVDGEPPAQNGTRKGLNNGAGRESEIVGPNRTHHEQPSTNTTKVLF